jgi:hypothetical protein
MAVSLCPGFPPVKHCPTVDVKEDKVIIGEKENVCTLTRRQFDILKEKIQNNEI